MNCDARQFFFRPMISSSSGDDGETSFLFQRILVSLFWFNSVLLHDGFALDDRPRSSSLSSIFYFWIFPTSFYEGLKIII